MMRDDDWRDADCYQMNELYSNLNERKKFPAICPVCKKNDAHIYMNLHDEKTRRGGLWTWCSECKTFSHGSHYVPGYWENCPSVEEGKLCAIPDYLDEMKEIIDAHVNDIIKNHIEEIKHYALFDKTSDILLK